MSDAEAPIEVFCSYAQEDRIWLEKLETHLSLLKRQDLISTWHKRLVPPGTNWEQDIDSHLKSALIILLLVSADFLASDYCYGIEMQHALERQRLNEARVIPILVRPVDWQDGPFKHLSVLPTGDKPISQWDNQDEALKNVVEGIRAALAEVQNQRFRRSPSASPRLWNVPYPRNPFFTGQEVLLTQLAETLLTGQPTALSQPQAVSGLGGIGKTQIAVEYAHRHRQNYQAIFWVRADTHEAIVSGYVTLAQNLNLPEKEEKDQTVIVQAVLRWLSTHTGWLLILDNADDLPVLEGLLPLEHRGHLLITTRTQALGTLAHPLEVAIMPQDVGATLLLRRARLIATNASLEAASSADVTIARAISEELGGLPLALDQAGAYIEESRCSLARYQKLYRLQPSPLLKRRGGFKHDYPASVATTWSLSFKKVEQQNPMAAELLRCCAFVHPDTIPEELFTAGAVHLGAGLQQMRRNLLAFDEAVRVLLAYSLIHRDPATATFSIHRLVQVVLIDAMPTRTRKLWRVRIMRALNEVFPEGAFEEWTTCGRLLPHTLLSMAWIEYEPIPTTPAEAHLLHKAGNYLRERGQYSEAEPLLVQAYMIHEQHSGTEHLDTASSLNNLALLYREQGKYEKAESLYRRVLAVYEQHWGAEHPDIAKSLSNLALLHERQGKYEQAASLYQRALTIQQKHSGAEHPDTAMSLNGLAVIYWQQSKYEEAEHLFQRALAIRELHLGAEHPDTAKSLYSLAALYWQQSKYEEAEPLFQRALAIREMHLGAEHPDTAKSLIGLAILYRIQRKYKESEALFQRALAIQEHSLGAEHPDTAGSLEDLAILYQDQGMYEKAESLYLRALTIREQHLGAEHPNTARNLNNLAELYRHQNKYELAEPLHLRALAIWEQHLGTDHPDTAEALHGLAELYRQKGKYEQAEVFYQRALAIREQRLGLTHPETQNTRKGYTALLGIIGGNREATMLDTSDEPSAESER